MYRTVLRLYMVSSFLAPVFLSAVPSALAQVRVVASTSDLAYFAEQIGGDRVDVDFIASGNRDMHYIDVLPSYMLKLRKADIYLKVGLELDLWAQALIDGSRNSKLRVIDCSRGIVPLEVPAFKADARYGDLHRYGNPHYWLGPDNVPIICRTIADALAAAAPAHREQFTEGLATYLAAFAEKCTTWKAQHAALSRVRFVAYHNTWPYLCDYFGCRTTAFIEEFPGVPPSPSHLGRLVEQITNDTLRVVAYEPFHDPRVPVWLREKTGCRLVILSASVGGVSGTDTYETLIDTLLTRLLNATKER